MDRVVSTCSKNIAIYRKKKAVFLRNLRGSEDGFISEKATYFLELFFDEKKSVQHITTYIKSLRKKRK